MQVAFPKLKSLDVGSLNVGKIWKNDQLSSTSKLGFQSLTRLSVVECDHLRGPIPSSVATNLVNLQHLWIENCKAMVEVVMFTKESAQEAKMLGNISIFPKLETLHLRKLPNLERICGDCVDWSSLLRLGVEHCPKLREFIIKKTMPTTENENVDEDVLNPVDKLLRIDHKVT